MNQINDIEEIYIDNYKIVYKYLLANSHNKDVAEELTQETFYRAVKNINKFKGDSKISSWLCQIAKNLCESFFVYMSVKILFWHIQCEFQSLLACR